MTKIESICEFCGREFDPLDLKIDWVFVFNSALTACKPCFNENAEDD